MSHTVPSVVVFYSSQNDVSGMGMLCEKSCNVTVSALHLHAVVVYNIMSFLKRPTFRCFVY